MKDNCDINNGPQDSISISDVFMILSFTYNFYFWMGTANSRGETNHSTLNNEHSKGHANGQDMYKINGPRIYCLVLLIFL